MRELPRDGSLCYRELRATAQQLSYVCPAVLPFTLHER